MIVIKGIGMLTMVMIVMMMTIMTIMVMVERRGKRKRIKGEVFTL